MNRRIFYLLSFVGAFALAGTACGGGIVEEPTFTPSATLMILQATPDLPETGATATQSENRDATIPVENAEGPDATPTAPGASPQEPLVTQTSTAAGSLQDTETPGGTDVSQETVTPAATEEVTPAAGE